MSDPIYAIGDIHGQFEMLQRALEKIERDGGPDAKIVFLGDYVDRGPQSQQVIQLLMDGSNAGKNWTCLLGNHDRMFSMFMEDYPRNDSQLLVGYHWLHDRIGGLTTLASYDVDGADRQRIYHLHENARSTVPAEHLQFLKNLVPYHLGEKLLFVHAGIRPGVAIQEQTENDLVWIREEFLDDPRAHPWLVVHGHTNIPVATHYGNRVNLDSGAGYGYPLSTAVFEGQKCWLLTDDGRTSLKP
ncbi:metallophosphoesterase family protein [Maritalea sp.]|jgi:serine/threonine protein phosphatase 1|uniref:metallophosphoesterase family protein n=1 Tax=Maritalea sp. TaxID=2003361 RepID=UPI0039E2CBE6